jgi:hypothetical protein
MKERKGEKKNARHNANEESEVVIRHRVSHPHRVDSKQEDNGPGAIPTRGALVLVFLTFEDISRLARPLHSRELENLREQKRTKRQSKSANALSFGCVLPSHSRTY